MQRRNFLKLVAAGTGAAAVGRTGTEFVGTARAAVGANCGTSDGLADVEFASSSSLLDANYGALTDDSVVAVWAESSASNTDADGNGDAYYYDDSTDVPVVAVESS